MIIVFHVVVVVVMVVVVVVYMRYVTSGLRIHALRHAAMSKTIFKLLALPKIAVKDKVGAVSLNFWRNWV